MCKTFFESRDSDHKSLKELKFIHMKAVLVWCGELSKLDFQSVKQSGECKAECGTPKLERIFDEADLDNLAAQACTGGINSFADEETVDCDTLFKKNNTTPSTPSDLNFAARETTTELFEHLVGVADNQKEEHNKKKAGGHSGPEPLSQSYILFAGDGDPIKTGLNIKATDPDRRCERFVPLCGMFHSPVELFEKSNSRDEDFVAFLMAPLCAKKDKEATEKNLSCFFNFSDPTEAEKHTGVALTAIYLPLLVEMKKSDRVDATPATTHKYVEDQSAKSPQDMRLFLLVDFWTMALLCRKAERRNNIELCCSCMRLSLPTLAVENATNYVLMFTELLKIWATCSGAERDLTKKHAFVVETPNGVFVGVGCCREKCVRLVRDETGKTTRRGTETKTEHAALCRPHQQETQGIKGRKKHKGRDLMHHDAESLTKLFLLLSSVGAWCNTAPKSHEFDTDAAHSTQEVGDTLPRELLHLDSTGAPLVSNRVKKFACVREPVAKREGTGLVKRKLSAKGTKDRLQRLRTSATSVNRKNLEKSGTADELKKEMLKLSSVVEDGFPANVNSTSGKRQLAETLVKLRKGVLKDNIDVLQEWEKEAEQEAIGGESTFENGHEELQRERHPVELDENTSLTQHRVELWCVCSLELQSTSTCLC